MLLKLTGSSGAGKSTLAVAGRLDGVAVHEFDEVGVPGPPIPPHWRNQMTEFWVRRALEYQARGVDLLLSGNSPLGEVLAAPSAPLLHGIAVCLIDADDAERRDRLAARDGGRWDQAALDAFCGWAAWHRGHARDPRWHTQVIDTDSSTLMKSADEVEQWRHQPAPGPSIGKSAPGPGPTGSEA